MKPKFYYSELDNYNEEHLKRIILYLKEVIECSTPLLKKLEEDSAVDTALKCYKRELEEKILNIIHYFLFSEYDYDISKYVYDEKKADICVRLLDLIGVDEETEQLFWYVTTGKPKC